MQDCYISVHSHELGNMVTNRLKLSLSTWAQILLDFSVLKFCFTYLVPIGCRVRSPLFTSSVILGFWHGLIRQF